MLGGAANEVALLLGCTIVNDIYLILISVCRVIVPPLSSCRLVSTSGYVVVDDTHHPQFDNSSWPWVVNQTFPQPDPSSCNKVDPMMVCVASYPGLLTSVSLMCVCVCGGGGGGGGGGGEGRRGLVNWPDLSLHGMSFQTLG